MICLLKSKKKHMTDLIDRHSQFGQRATSLLSELNLCNPDDIVSIQPLAGGIASDIALVETDYKKFCVKFALPKMRVKADWYAPVERNRTEFLWLKLAAELAPECTPNLYGYSDTVHGFAMEYLQGPNTYMWKSSLFEKSPSTTVADSVGRLIGRMHASSAQPGFNRAQFDSKNIFYDMRIEPYILHLSAKHPELRTIFAHVADKLHSSEISLVHGDVSPKNIMIHNDRTILVDAECASMGEPAFDIAFCLNHFFLKAILRPDCKKDFLNAALAFWESYQSWINWEPISILEQRIASLLPILGLARIDGKSPVEYFGPKEHEQVREIVIPLIVEPQDNLDSLFMTLFAD